MLRPALFACSVLVTAAVTIGSVSSSLAHESDSKSQAKSPAIDAKTAAEAYELNKEGVALILQGKGAHKEAIEKFDQAIEKVLAMRAPFPIGPVPIAPKATLDWR